MSEVVDPKVMRVARSVAQAAMRDGARAVVLMGSHVRGDAHAESDIDLVVMLDAAPSGRKLPRPIQERSGYLVTMSWETVSSALATFRTPKLVGTFVPGWRQAVIIADPEGIAARLQRRAVAVRWEAIAAACDAWVAEEITGFVEEVRKLVGLLKLGRTHAAAAQRSILALRMAPIIAVHLRILYGSENVLWDRVAGAMGARWRRAQARAFGEGGESLVVSCRAALELYALAAAAVWGLLDRRQRVAVAHACAIAGHPIERIHRKGAKDAKTN